MEEYLFENNALSVNVLQSFFTDGPACACAYFAPGHTGDIFPLIRRKAIELEANPDALGANGDVLAALVDIAIDTWRAAKLCGSESCRSVTSTAFALVDNLANSDKSTSPPSMVSTTCNADVADHCLNDGCSITLPFVNSIQSGCAQCFRPATASVQTTPFRSIDSKNVDRTLFWASCFLSTDCPADGVRGFAIVATFTIQPSDLESFDEDAFVSALVTTLAPSGSAADDILSTADISVNVDVESGTVEVSIAADNVAIRNAVSAQLSTLTPVAASSALGVTVNMISNVTVETINFAPPTPPPVPPTAPPQAPNGRRMRIPRVAIITGATVGGVLIIFVLVGICVCCRRREARRGRLQRAGGASVKREPTVTFANVTEMELGNQPAPPSGYPPQA